MLMNVVYRPLKMDDSFWSRSKYRIKKFPILSRRYRMYHIHESLPEYHIKFKIKSNTFSWIENKSKSIVRNEI